MQVLLIGGSTGTMLEALQVIGGDTHDGHLTDVSIPSFFFFFFIYQPNSTQLKYIYIFLPISYCIKYIVMIE